MRSISIHLMQDGVSYPDDAVIQNTFKGVKGPAEVFLVKL
jgi:hypothetical protein